MKKAFILMVKGYRMFISPYLAKSCRYTPSCSEYTIEALERFGPFKGLALAAWRVLRCNPFSRGGADPVPRRQ